jgi:cysteine desulfurase
VISTSLINYDMLRGFMNKPLYIDHQATTPAETSVLEAMKPFWSESFGNPHSSDHVIGWHSNAEIQKSKQRISRMIGASADEIFFTSGATESNNLAAFSLCDLARLHPEKRQILLSPIDHKCIINAGLFWADKFNLDVKMLEVDERGYIDLDFLLSSLKTPSLFCSIGFVNNEIGTIQDIEAISGMLRKAECMFHSDAAQAPKTTDCKRLASLTDLLSFSGHKMGGPQGVGFLYLNAQLQESITPLMQGGGQQNGIRSGTLPLPLCVGIGEACQMFQGPEALEKRHYTSKVRDHFYSGLLKLKPNIVLNGPPLADRHVANLNISFVDVDATELLMSLQPNICASTGSACSSGAIEDSHVLKAIGLSSARCGSAVRFSFSHTNSIDEADLALEYIRECF